MNKSCSVLVNKQMEVYGGASCQWATMEKHNRLDGSTVEETDLREIC